MKSINMILMKIKFKRKGNEKHKHDINENKI